MGGPDSMQALIQANRIGAEVSLDLAIRIEELVHREARTQEEHERSLARLAMGGLTEFTNLQTLCACCNLGKRDR